MCIGPPSIAEAHCTTANALASQADVTEHRAPIHAGVRLLCHSQCDVIPPQPFYVITPSTYRAVN